MRFNARGNTVLFFHNKLKISSYIFFFVIQYVLVRKLGRFLFLKAMRPSTLSDAR